LRRCVPEALGSRPWAEDLDTDVRSRFRGTLFALKNLLILKKLFQMRFNSEPGEQALHRGVRLHLGRVEVKLLAPHQSCRYAQLDDLLEEAAEDLKKPLALPDAGEAGVMGQRLV
jgi:hypothetical protein